MSSEQHTSRDFGERNAEAIRWIQSVAAAAAAAAAAADMFRFQVTGYGRWQRA
jgi:hypothetical protein